MNSGFDRITGDLSKTFGPTCAEPISVANESITAFVGPTSRGPVGRAIPIYSTTEFEHWFGVAARHCPMEFAIRQFFANGGRRAVVVRVSASSLYNSIRLPTEDDEQLVLEARNPGPYEFLRASIDYDGIPIEQKEYFNLVVQRLRGVDSVWIDAQEYFRRVSVDSRSRDYVGYVLTQSELVCMPKSPPASRPMQTIKPGTVREAGYVGISDLGAIDPPPSDYDIVGSAVTGTGLNALEQIDDIGQLCVITGMSGTELGPIALLAIDQFCKRHHSVFIVDPPPRWDTVDAVLKDQNRTGYSSRNTITWFPRPQYKNEQNQWVPTTACGAVAAVLLEADRTRGLQHLQDSEYMMARGGAKISPEASETDQVRLARVGVNTLTRRSALHMQLRSNVTAARQRYVVGGGDELSLQRDVLLVLRRISEGTRWVGYHESSPSVWKELRRQLREFMEELQEHSVIVAAEPEKSFLIKCDIGTNPEYLQRPHELVFAIGIALKKPGEFLTFRFRQTPEDCRIAELGWHSDLVMAMTA